ncbi:hypothetical protein M409DRAFT_61562 [Zasmidium cellare ATCC 36951]|uniref:Uncharacterized protein n=1 Tax=Zasmidium cellare ATCC 36951 TaxID=1080233 RepID=A0A6A6BX79_ZASCE|nr:uncharacterized protein M409DRAFT_61562 [Zasmidium cellare ATCC 36951]KAF2158550.1 hypothetical protein M409DRAFT_61562 [Zasmidium cellare ATCC 36951]
MRHENRIDQLTGLHHVETNGDFYEKQSATSSLANSTMATQPLYIPVPVTIKAQLGSPTALATGAFSTTLTTLSFALMGWRGVSVTNAFIGDFFGVAGVGMFVSANWELVLGNTYAYTVFAAFGLFYAGFGFIVTPSFGVADAYGGPDSAQYNNAVGFFVLMWAVWNLFFLVGSIPLNLVYIAIFFTVQMAFTLVSVGYFLKADGLTETSIAVNKVGGGFAFASGMLGYYTVGNLMCQESIRFTFPMGDTSRPFKRVDKSAQAV